MMARRAGRNLDRVNLRDIAEAAGVSVQTVSRVVRDVGGVAPATRDKVLEAVNRMGYQPNLAARSLSSRRTGWAHVIVAVPLLHGHARAFVTICDALAVLGLNASTSIVPPRDAADLDLSRLVPLGADGVIVLGGDAEPKPWLEQISHRMPMVYIGQTSGLPDNASGLMIDQLGGARAATAHLIERGARRLVHIAGPQYWIDARLRQQGFEEVCRDSGVESMILAADAWDASIGRRLGTGLSGDGVFAANDQLALGLMGALHEAGQAMPGEVRVVGFDDIPGSDSFYPPLTTVRQDFQRLGKRAVEALKSLMDGGAAENIVIPTRLIVRDST